MTLSDTLELGADENSPELTAQNENAADMPEVIEQSTGEAAFPEHESSPEEAEANAEPEETLYTDEDDYESILKEDIEALKREFSSLENLKDITELDNPLRYAALRDLGLTPREAYLATSKERPKRDNRSHLNAAAPRTAAKTSHGMSYSELLCARELFSDITDAEIYSLYKRVSR